MYCERCGTDNVVAADAKYVSCRSCYAEMYGADSKRYHAYTHPNAYKVSGRRYGLLLPVFALLGVVVMAFVWAQRKVQA